MSDIDIHSLRSVREADIVLGDDFVTPKTSVDAELREQRKRRGLVSLKQSPLARKIITFNLLALLILVGGVLYLNASRDSLAFQRASGLLSEVELIADVFEAQMPAGAPVSLATGDGIDPQGTLSGLDLRNPSDIFVFDPTKTLVASSKGADRPNLGAALDSGAGTVGKTYLIDGLSRGWAWVAGIFGSDTDDITATDSEGMVRQLLDATLAGETKVVTGPDQNGDTVFSVATPILQGDQVVGVIAMASASGEIDLLVRSERENLLQMFVIAILVSVGLSLVLASTIANPLSDLAAAAEIGREKNSNKVTAGRVRIPDLSGRPDEIGRLSGALRGMVSALYERIESNEQFAADVAHEIKNPLASLRSAVGTMRVAKRDDQREKLLDVIDHDVRRLDRLVSDISNASRLDSELVKETEEQFDLLHMLGNITEYLTKEAADKGVEFVTDLPNAPIQIYGLEGRLAQVFVNLITNAISFCEDGDAIRVWARMRDNRILVVVEDTGPGIPDNALHKVFKRFYSERPEQQFGNNSGLGLAISKQIVEAHGGVIWAENIRPTDADPVSEPLGARFVVGLPV
ncbi:sensor histidine kinase [Nereida sp. MMG025]|uniref:sensor histidine kinase n=1 Tax=Nereida sp. MMG025 TaxID=2909981 RepID=UPI001F3F8670|nr:sensor histidine kinase [Nereida sp. MMG025]MCF6445950.1 sensor histidine kinase [Nereida sp. MMG025]